MIVWIVLVAVTALFSYLTDIGATPLLREPVPFFGGSTISVVMMITCIMMLVRAAKMSKRGEKESLRERIAELEEELASHRASSASPPRQEPGDEAEEPSK